MQQVYQITFACIGWASMLFTPVLHQNLLEFSFSHQPVTSASHRQVANVSKRRVGALLRGFGVMPLYCQLAQRLYSGEATLLAVSCFNYFFLKMQGDLTIF